MMKKIAAVSAALAIGALSQFALAQTTTPAPTTTPQTKPATPPTTTTKPATTPATTPKATTTKKTATPSPCKGLEEAACGGKTECSWVKATVDKNGKARKAYCRLKPATKATAPKSTAPATTTPATTTTAPKVTPPPATTTKPKTQ